MITKVLLGARPTNGRRNGRSDSKIDREVKEELAGRLARVGGVDQTGTRRQSKMVVEWGGGRLRMPACWVENVCDGQEDTSPLRRCSGRERPIRGALYSHAHLCGGLGLDTCESDRLDA